MATYEEQNAVTYKQISDMKHTIGFENSRIRGTKHRKYEPYRNYFCAGEDDETSMDQLVSIGFMSKSVPTTTGYMCSCCVGVYHVTESGKQFLEKVTGVHILPDME